MTVRTRARVVTRRVPVLTTIACAVGMAAVTAAPQGSNADRLASDQGPAAPAALLSGSEISVTESGGIAGRVHSVRLTASSGRVEVQYRSRAAPRTAPAGTGSLSTERYLAFWRELEAAKIWDMASPRPTSGADLMQTELSVRVGESSHVVRWDEGHQLAPDVRRVAEIARRLLAAGPDTSSPR